MKKGKRYYPIVENFDDIRGYELEGPLATISSCKRQQNEYPSEIENSVEESIQEKVRLDERFSDDDMFLFVKEKKWSEEKILETYCNVKCCDIYKMTVDVYRKKIK